MTDLRVAFPEPCSEPWDGMEPRGCNRHCASCDRTVFDLSAMTVDEAEVLLDSNEQVCVRAVIDNGGRILTKAGSRALVAGAGALLLAACQTTPGGQVEDGYHLSGSVGAFPRSPDASITSASGETVDLQIGRDGRFDVHGLRPGTYTLNFSDRCGVPEDSFSQTVVVEADVDVGILPWDYGCIVVGQMVREKPTSRG